jgi:hypothetical protein
VGGEEGHAEHEGLLLRPRPEKIQSVASVFLCDVNGLAGLGLEPVLGLVLAGEVEIAGPDFSDAILQ